MFLNNFAHVFMLHWVSLDGLESKITRSINVKAHLA